MAAFEWAKGELNPAADAPVATIEQVVALLPERWGAMAPRPIAALRRLELHCNMPPVCRALARDETPPAPPRTRTAHGDFVTAHYGPGSATWPFARPVRARCFWATAARRA